MSINFDLKADSREKLGSAESRRIRKSGNIPAIVYDNGNNINISVPSREFEREYYKGNISTTLINLDISGKSKKVVINKIEVDPVTDRPSHITFIKAGDKVKVKVKVTFFNREKSPGIKRGGFLHITSRKVELLCPVDAIPEELTVDIGKMKVGQKIKNIDLELPKNTSFVNKKEFNIASIIGRGSKEEGEGAAVNADGSAIVAEEESAEEESTGNEEDK